MASNVGNGSKCAELYKNIDRHTWPIVYSDSYNMEFQGLEALHRFDSSKYGKIFKFLEEPCLISKERIVEPLPPTREHLLEFHSAQYLDSLESPANVASIAEVSQLAQLTNEQIQDALLSKLRLQTSGTILAAKLALDRQWSINIGGGFHHCSSNQGGGFCHYADISGALMTLYRQGLIKRALIIDLDAHRGNGHEIDFRNSDWVHTLDVYNDNIYPGPAAGGIDMRNLVTVKLQSGAADDEYLAMLPNALRRVFSQFGRMKPDIIAYNAGTDCMRGDPLGQMDITPQGIMKRDQIVFTEAKRAKIPIFMVLSGGYQPETARVIADSILNLSAYGLIPRNS